MFLKYELYPIFEIKIILIYNILKIIPVIICLVILIMYFFLILSFFFFFSFLRIIAPIIQHFFLFIFVWIIENNSKNIIN